MLKPLREASFLSQAEGDLTSSCHSSCRSLAKESFSRAMVETNWSSWTYLINIFLMEKLRLSPTRMMRDRSPLLSQEPSQPLLVLVSVSVDGNSC